MVKKLSALYLEARKAICDVEDMQTASLLARNLLAFVTEKSQEQLVAEMDHYASDAVCQKMSEAVDQVVNGRPLAYIIGEWDFFGMTLYVDPNVLIPRDDTCAVTELAIKKTLYLDKSPRILDLCTGSGCIGLAIAHRVKDARVTLADISKEALAVAKRNVSAQKLSGRVSCVQVDAMTEPISFLGQFDLIVSNPPYITTSEMEELPQSVRAYEPHLALHGGEDGLDFYRSISSKFKKSLKSGGYLCFEYGRGQGDAVCGILEENGYTILERSRDYNNIERAVIAQLNRKEE